MMRISRYLPCGSRSALPEISFHSAVRGCLRQQNVFRMVENPYSNPQGSVESPGYTGTPLI